MLTEVTGDRALWLETTSRFMETACPMSRVRELVDDERGFDEAWLRQGAELGWFSLLVDEAHGGGSVSGDGVVDAALLAYECGRHVQPGPLLPMSVVAAALGRVGSDEQRATVLPALLAGGTVAAWAPLDAHGRFDEEVGLSATPTAGGYRLDGVRGTVQDAHAASWLLVTAALDGAPTQFLVPKDAPGVTVRPRACLDLARRVADVRLEGVEVDTRTLVGAPGGAADELERQLEEALVLQCAETAGAINELFARTVQYTKDRIAFGRPIGSFQGLKHLMADVGLWVETATAGAHVAAEALQVDDPQAAPIVSSVKAYVGDVGVDVVQQCLQLHGGIGYTWEHDLHLFLRRVTTNRALYGDPAWHRERLWRLATSSAAVPA
ncbi:MAG TPA: acyl-CoA dehydrogenase family protein [Acidimicrobiales bacterium]|nr:acyl-CoA dehydrogenase family protein [Acidimicrobiales bacterium]